MKLHLLQCGTIRTRRSLIEGIAAGDEPYEVPVPFFLIEQEDHLILFDVGNSYREINTPSTGEYITQMTTDDYVVSQLAKLGRRTGDITHIILSHLHTDHAGGLEAFENVPCYLQRSEVSEKERVALENKYPLQWTYLNGDYDLIDGIQLLSTPGHTPGHQSLLLRSDRGKRIFLAADAAYTCFTLESHNLSPATALPSAAIQSLERIDALSKQGVYIVFGHDPEQWHELRQKKTIL